uniref:Uncharacterized protein n=1 Tax=Oryza brachyantha TaxID=4533 RepID=J3MTJ3_ORYBR
MLLQVVTTVEPDWFIASRMSPRISPAPCTHTHTQRICLDQVSTQAGHKISHRRLVHEKRLEIGWKTLLHHRRRRCRRLRRHTGSSYWGPRALFI